MSPRVFQTLLEGVLVDHCQGEDAYLDGEVRDALLQQLRFRLPVRLQIVVIFLCV